MDLREVNLLAADLRKSLEQKDANDVIVQGKIANIERELDKFEEKNAKLVAEISQKHKDELDLKEKIDNLEKKLYRLPSSAAQAVEKSPEFKAFENFIKFGEKYVERNLETKYLRTDINSDGGFLAPAEFVTEMLKKITEISGVRQVSRVRTTTRHSLEIPKRTQLLEAFWVGEGNDIIESQSLYGLETIKVNKLAVYTIATTEMLSDAAFNMEAEISQDIVERFAQKEGQAFIQGNGIEKPEGILFNSDVEEIKTGVANDITADSLIELTGQLKVGYNPVFMMNRRTLARIRRLKDGQGQYLWMPSMGAGLTDGQPATILGYPYVSAIDVDDIAPNTSPVIFGDFLRGYNIVDHVDMTMIRDQYTLSTSGKVKFISHRRVGAQVVMPEAIKKLRVGV